MEQKKSKLSEETKAKLIYSGEILVFAIIFFILGILRFVGKIEYKPTRIVILNWITMFGGAWGIADFIWAVASKRRRERISMIDKILVLPLVIYMYTFDIICFTSRPEEPKFYIYALGIAFIYVGVIYTFEAIYHWFKPVPMLLEEDNPPVEVMSEEEKQPEESKNL